MYLLVSEVVRACIESRTAPGSPLWLMYDTFWGASRGLAFFKERLGFRPYTVAWHWVDRDLTSAGPTVRYSGDQQDASQ